MASIEDTLRTLKAKIATATASQARAQVEYDNATKDVKAALAEMKTFGASTPAEASALLKTLEADLAAELEKVETELQASGA